MADELPGPPTWRALCVDAWIRWTVATWATFVIIAYLASLPKDASWGELETVRLIVSRLSLFELFSLILVVVLTMALLRVFVHIKTYSALAEADIRIARDETARAVSDKKTLAIPSDVDLAVAALTNIRVHHGSGGAVFTAADTLRVVYHEYSSNREEGTLASLFNAIYLVGEFRAQGMEKEFNKHCVAHGVFDPPLKYPVPAAWEYDEVTETEERTSHKLSSLGMRVATALKAKN